MANNQTTNPWVLDTAGSTDLWPNGMVFVEQFEFYNYVLDADTCVLTDRNGVTVWVGNGADDLETIRSGKIGPVNGLKLTTLDNAAGGSRVAVYIR